MRSISKTLLVIGAAVGFAHAALGNDTPLRQSEARQRIQRIQAVGQQGPSQLPGAPMQLQATPLSCATGFQKTDEQKNSEGLTHFIECTTPVITCPNQAQFTTVTLDVEKLNSGGDVNTYRIRYSCQGYDPQG